MATAVRGDAVGGEGVEAKPFLWAAVFCGARRGSDPAFAAAAAELGRELLARGLGLVYGGSTLGLMGEVGLAMREGGGALLGVTTEEIDIFAQTVSSELLPETVVQKDAQACRTVMVERADFFVCLPGGSGTLAELCVTSDSFTAPCVKAKPVGVLNIGTTPRRGWGRRVH